MGPFRKLSPPKIPTSPAINKKTGAIAMIYALKFIFSSSCHLIVTDYADLLKKI
jgi:hypothetical protein